MTNKRQILQIFSRTVLLEIARAFEVSGLTTKKREDIVDALMRIRSIPAEDILNALRIGDLKNICRENSISPKSWRKDDIIKALSEWIP